MRGCRSVPGRDGRMEGWRAAAGDALGALGRGGPQPRVGAAPAPETPPPAASPIKPPWEAAAAVAAWGGGGGGGSAEREGRAAGPPRQPALQVPGFVPFSRPPPSRSNPPRPSTRSLPPLRPPPLVAARRGRAGCGRRADLIRGGGLGGGGGCSLPCRPPAASGVRLGSIPLPSPGAGAGGGRSEG